LTYKTNDRVVLQSQFKAHFGIIPAGTICTIVSTPKGDENEILIMRSGFDANTGRPVLIGAAESLLRKVNEEDLRDADYKNLVAMNFWVGAKFKTGYATSFEDVGPGEIGTIEKIKLAPNESKDFIIFSFNGKQHGFERSFVENYMDKYDEEVEEMFGEEMNLKDMPRNYYLPGARMIHNNEEIVILQYSSADENLYVIETMFHEELEVEKDTLTPILSAENFLSYQEEDVVQLYYRTGSQFIATEDISNHAILKSKIKQNDVIEILHNNGVNINAFEDSFKVVVNEEFTHPINVSYLDLKMFFKPHIQASNDNEEVEEEINFDFDAFKKDQEQAKIDLFKKIEESQDIITTVVKVMDVEIYGFRFKVDEKQKDRFTIDGQDKKYLFDEIDYLIAALEKLKEFK